MGWRRAEFKGKSVWAEVDGGGALKTASGRVGIRYSERPGAKVYPAGARGVQLLDDASVQQLDAGELVEKDSQRTGSGGKKSSSGFGKAGKRTEQQAARAAGAARELIGSLSGKAVLCFTDGACHGNPGPAGSGAAVFLLDGRRGEASRCLGQGTNNIAELTAIAMALELLDEADLPANTAIALFTDSNYAHGLLTKGWKAKANQALVRHVRSRLSRWTALDLHWVAGHVGVEGNERADALATEGVGGIDRSEWSGAGGVGAT